MTTVVEFVGGPQDGFRAVLPEPLPSHHAFLQCPELLSAEIAQPQVLPSTFIHHDYLRTDRHGAAGQRIYEYAGAWLR